MRKSGHVHSVISHADHARKIIVHGSAENVAERHEQEDDRSEFNAQNDTDDGTDSRDVQQLDEYIFPVRKDHSIYTVWVSDSWSLSVVGTEYVLHEFSIGEVASD